MTDRRYSYLGVDERWRLAHALRPIAESFGTLDVYLVGSVLERSDYRDVDVRLILPDCDFRVLFKWPDCLIDQFRLMLQTAISEMLQEQTRLNVDFQVQSQSECQKYKDRKRHGAIYVAYVNSESAREFIPQWARIAAKLLA